eukprot:s569_g33.t3
MAPKRVLKQALSDDSDVQFVPPSTDVRPPAFDLQALLSTAPPASRCSTTAAISPSGFASRGTGAGGAASSSAADVLPDRVSSDSSQNDAGHKKTDEKTKKEKKEQKRKDKKEKKKTSKRKTKDDDDDDEDEDDPDASHKPLGEEGDDEDDFDAGLDSLEGLETLLDGDDTKKPKKRPASKGTGGPKKRPSGKKADDGVLEAPMPEPFQYMIEGDSYAAYRSQPYDLTENTQPKDDSYWPDNQLGLPEYQDQDHNCLLDTQLDDESDAMSQENPPLHRGFASEDFSPILEGDVEEKDLADDHMMGHDGDDALAALASPAKMTEGLDDAVTTASGDDALAAHASPAKMTEGLDDAAKVSPRSARKITVKKGKNGCGGPKAKAKPKGKALKASSKARAKPKAKSAAAKAAKVQIRKDKDDVEKKMHSVYSGAHKAARVAKMTPEAAKEMAHFERRKWILENKMEDHPAAKRFL